MKPIKSSFKLGKVKLVKDGGLDVVFQVEEQIGQEVYTEKYHTESTKDIHPDLIKAISGMKTIMARVYHMNFFRMLMTNDEFNATPEQSEIAEKLYQEILAKIRITGLSLSGQDANEGVVISGTFTADTNQKMAINSHRIKFTDTKYGFEEDLEITTDEIKEEVYAFLFENKRAQLSLFGNDDDEGVFDGKAAAAGTERDDEFEEADELEEVEE